MTMDFGAEVATDLMALLHDDAHAEHCRSFLSHMQLVAAHLDMRGKPASS